MPITLNGDGTIPPVTAVQPTGSILQVVSPNLTAPSSVSYSSAALSASTPVTVDITSTVANSKFVISGMVHGEAER